MIETTELLLYTINMIHKTFPIQSVLYFFIVVFLCCVSIVFADTDRECINGYINIVPCNTVGDTVFKNHKNYLNPLPVQLTGFLAIIFEKITLPVFSQDTDFTTVNKTQPNDTSTVSNSAQKETKVTLPQKIQAFFSAFFNLVRNEFLNKDNDHAPRIALTPDKDSEQLLYDDAFMDEMIKTYTIRSLTASLSRLGYTAGIDCHNRAHELGRRAYGLIGSDSFKNCGIECHSGCRHGATEAFFADKGTTDLIEGMHFLCGEEQDRFNMHQCVHGVGHGLMAWFDYKLYDALSACDLINKQYHRESCYSGVFMENIVGGIVRDDTGENKVYHYTNFLNDDPHYPCNAVEDKYKSQCYWLQTDQMIRLFGNFDDVAAACAEAPKPFQFYCFHSFGRSTSGHFFLNPIRSFEACGNISTIENKDACLLGALNNLLWDETQADGAIEFCRLTQSSPYEKKCYAQLIIQISEVVSKESKKSFCQKLPTAYYNSCISQESPSAIPLPISEKNSNINDMKKTNNTIIRYIKWYICSRYRTCISWLGSRMGQ